MPDLFHRQSALLQHAPLRCLSGIYTGYSSFFTSLRAASIRSLLHYDSDLFLYQAHPALSAQGSPQFTYTRVPPRRFICSQPSGTPRAGVRSGARPDTTRPGRALLRIFGHDPHCLTIHALGLTNSVSTCLSLRLTIHRFHPAIYALIRDSTPETFDL
jgi:hypothetical protein